MHYVVQDCGDHLEIIASYSYWQIDGPKSCFDFYYIPVFKIKFIYVCDLFYLF